MKLKKLLVVTGLLAALALPILTPAVHAEPQAGLINVTTTDDEYDNVGTGKGCSLREAVTAANTDAAFGGCPKGNGTDTLQLAGAQYKFTRTGTNTANAHGDLNLTSDMTIQGMGPASTEIDGAQLDRVIKVEAGSVTIKRLGIKNGLTIQYGGGIYVTGATLTLDETRIHHNTSPFQGGGLANDGTTIVYKSLIDSNTATLRGGGISNDYDGILIMTNSRVSDNQARDGGGILNVSSSPSIVSTSTIDGNEAVGAAHNTGIGGGILAKYGLFTLTNSTLSGNRANGFGGGAYTGGTTTLRFYNATVTDNTANFNQDAEGIGGGLFVNKATGASALVQNTILAQNRHLLSNGAAANDCAGGEIISGGYNLFGTGTCSIAGVNTGNQIGVNPQLNPLADNGGPTLTHALKSTSPAMDAGDPGGCKDASGVWLEDDQRGAPRHVDGDIVSGVRCDIGALEFENIVVPECSGMPIAPQLAKPQLDGKVKKVNVTLKWNKVNCATKYKVRVRQDAKNGPPADKKTVPGTEHTTKALEPGHKYFWRVRSCNDEGCAKSGWFWFFVKP